MVAKVVQRVDKIRGQRSEKFCGINSQGRSVSGSVSFKMSPPGKLVAAGLFSLWQVSEPFDFSFILLGVE